MADIGSLVVKLAAETSQFQEDMGKATRTVTSKVEEMRASMLSMESVAKRTFAVVIGVESVGALAELAKATIGAAAGLKDLSEKTGASVEAISAMAPVAKLSGLGLDGMAEGMIKLARGMAGAEDETAKAGAALKFLGINAKDGAGNLRDPAEVMQDIAQRLGEFRDGAGKTAIALDLFGKSGANLLPFLKDLGENTDLVVRLTAKQALQADDLEKSLKRLTAQKDAMVKTITLAAIPALSVLVEEFSKATQSSNGMLTKTKELSADGSLQSWAESAAMGVAYLLDVMQAAVQGVKALLSSFSSVWADIQLAGTFLAGGKGLNPFSEENRATLQAALDKRNATVAAANQQYVKLWEMPLLSDAVKKRFDEMRQQAAAGDVAPAKQNLNWDSGKAGKDTDNPLAVIEQRVRGLQALADDEAAIMRDRQKIIDLYEGQGYLKFKEATEARATAQQDFLEKSASYYDQEEALLRGALADFTKNSQERARVEEQLAAIALKRQRLEREAAQATLEREIKSPFETLRDIQEQASRGMAEIKTREDQIKTLRESGAITEVESLRRLSAARKESADQLAELAAKAREVSDAAPGNEKFSDALRKIGEAARQAADGADLLAKRARELTDPQAGFGKGLRTVAEEAELVGKQIENVTVKAFNGMADALTQMVMTGKADFKSLANSIISDLIRIQIQRSITGPLANAMSAAFGFANGGIMTGGGPMPLRTYAGGGVANSPQMAVFGEGSMPEAYVPLPDGRSIPVTMKGGGGGGVVINIKNEGAADGYQASATTSQSGGQMSIEVMISKAMRNDVRNNGPMAQALSQAFGLQRRAV